MRTVGSAAALLMVAALAVGCGAVVDGTAKPAPNLKPRPLTGQTVRQVPLDDAALSRMLGQPFVAVIRPSSAARTSSSSDNQSRRPIA